MNRAMLDTTSMIDSYMRTCGEAPISLAMLARSGGQPNCHWTVPQSSSILRDALLIAPEPAHFLEYRWTYSRFRSVSGEWSAYRLSADPDVALWESCVGTQDGIACFVPSKGVAHRLRN